MGNKTQTSMTSREVREILTCAYTSPWWFDPVGSGDWVLKTKLRPSIVH